jgi:uncharacterized protein (DUF697 family)
MINPNIISEWNRLFFDWDKDPMGPREQQAAKIVRKNMYWAVGVGLIPIPIIDIAAVTLIQLDMLKELCKCYNVPYSEVKGKALLSAIGGAALARYWASLFKIVPVIGSALGGVSMAVLSGATTYALGKVFVNYLRESKDLDDIDTQAAKAMFEEELETGKDLARAMQQEAEQNIYQQIEQLANLKDKGIITEKEFEAKKKDLLNRI